MTKELLNIADNINDLVALIGKTRREIEDKGMAKAKAISAYDKRLGIAIVTLRDEGKFPATLIEKIAKGVCAPERETMEMTDVAYKACLSNLEAMKAQLNAKQSVYRHLDET